MNDEKLSMRLEKVATFVRSGSVVADIGSDHAYLPIYLVKKGIVPRAIAGEVNEGPLSSAKEQIKYNDLNHVITAKLGNGLAVIQDESVNTVVIAGMGGPLIADILENGKPQLEGVERLILQPNVAADHVRRWLFNNGWSLIDEAILDEGDHVYEILVAESGDAKESYSDDLEKELWMGPHLLRNKNSAFNKKWNREWNQLEKVYDQLKQANDQKKLSKKTKDIQQKLSWLKEELS
ncbi:tRNA (adenine(22)-N(1))-methyltransferase TrmK [Salipaludibacillus keqinensis]|uniref:tRNA (Adenine(22)-N(1))-methyltransferase TrmK n=1 Tax=Salipaludibacillus keqinensis TaxID=2045207 RepID=A0A323TKP8_9BACI|nr:tRNA (adenine(22)-N(1))-methyltransferase TrmK [Salipaludibacillus keqinensis]PYZ94267.1 tRNA (adenine(22)-N(1))-methyltransferase TrmK [Salipaludibacillus keqinensis]